MSDLSTVSFAFAAVVGFSLEGLFAAGVAALSRITRSEAAEAFTSGLKGGKQILGIVAKRGAAMSGLAALRIACTALASLFLVLAIQAYTSAWWQTAGIFVSAFATVRLLMWLISPQEIGQRKAERVLGLVARPIALVTLFSPRASSREPNQEETEQIEEDQLAVMVERVSDSVVLDENDRELLQSVFDLNHTLAREVMVPRTDMVTITQDAPVVKVMSLFNRSGFSRVPVTGETVDDLLGVVYLKDVLAHYLDGTAAQLTVGDLMRDPVFVPEVKVVDELMREMQANQVHIALVVDEYGGIAGLVTIEDLVEELVGEISDEHDRSEPEVVQLAPEVYRVPAKLHISELGDLFGVKLEDDDVDTVGGLFSKLIGRVPIAGATATVNGITMVADHFGGRRRRMSSVIARREEKENND